MMQFADTALENLWDEICVQAQGQQSVFWDVYESYMQEVIEKAVEKDLKEYERKMIWLVSSGFEEWTSTCYSDDEEDVYKELFVDGFPANYDVSDICHYVYRKLLNAAGNYTNSRIESFLSSSYLDD